MAIENNMIPCPYNCKQRVHPKGSKFCPFTGKPIPKPPPVDLGGEEDDRPKTSPERKTVVKPKPNKKLFLLILLAVVIAGAAALLLLKDESEPEVVVDHLETEKMNKTGHLKDPKPEKSTETREKIKKAKDIVPPEAIEVDKIIKKTFSALASGIKRGIERQLKTNNLHRLTFYRRENIDVTGELILHLTIDENGRTSIQGFYPDGLIVNPESERSRIVGMLKKEIGDRIGNLTLTPQQDKNGAPLKITDFPLTVRIVESIKTLQFSDLSPGARDDFKAQTRDLNQIPVGENLEVKGKIEFLLTIDERGNINIQNNSDFNTLEVVPLSQRETVIETVKRKIKSRTFKPFQGENGILLKVRNVPVTAIPRQIEVKEFRQLSALVIQAYKRQMNQMGDIPVEKNIQVKGQISFRLAIDENGNISIEKSDNSPLLVTPQTSKSKITNMIKNQIQSRALTPQTGENGVFLKISNFPLTIEVTLNNGWMELERLREF